MSDRMAEERAQEEQPEQPTPRPIFRIVIDYDPAAREIVGIMGPPDKVITLGIIEFAKATILAHQPEPQEKKPDLSVVRGAQAEAMARRFKLVE